MKAIGIIPARMGSSRFLGKPLAKILGKPLIEHVWRGAKSSVNLSEVYIATCDEEIREAAEWFGAPVIMTSNLHQRAVDRVAEAAAIVNSRSGPISDVIMIQGDEPLVEAAHINALTGDPIHIYTNLVQAIEPAELNNTNVVKVAAAIGGTALFFSRHPIGLLRQVGIMVFKQTGLSLYSRLSPTPLEQAESIDMLRLLEHGYIVGLVETNVPTHAVDVPDDIQIVERLLEERAQSQSRSVVSPQDVS